MAITKKMSLAMGSAIDEVFGVVDPVLENYYDDQYKISTVIFDYRAKNGMTQSELAKYLGVTQAMVSKYESGDYNFTLRALHELFYKLGYVYESVIDTSREGTYHLSNAPTEDQEYSLGIDDDLPLAS